MLALRVRAGEGERPELVFAAWPGRPVLFVSSVPVAPPFVGRERDRAFGPPLDGAKIERIGSIPGERTLAVEVQSRTIGTARLELTAAGHATDAWLVAGEMTIAGLRGRGRGDGGGRVRVELGEGERLALGRLRRARPGGSALLCAEALYRCGLDQRDEIGELPEEVVDLFDALAEEVDASYDGYIYSCADGRSVWSPIPLDHLGKASRRESNVVFAGESLCAGALAERLFEEGRNEAARVIAKLKKQLARRESNIEKDLARSRRSEGERRKGEAILASLAELRRGMTEASIVDPYTGEAMTIELDPLLDPAVNAEHAFKEARKAADGEAHARRRLAETRMELARLEADEKIVSEASEPNDLHTLARLVPRLRLRGDERRESARRPAVRRKKGMLGELDPRWRRYSLPGEWIVLAARNAKDNDLLTQKVAHMSDFWFHARGCPGSHVVLRCAGRKERPPKAILEATAAIAAYHSKARNSRLVPVAYAPKRYVRKPKGSKAGLVFMNREVVTFVRPGLPEGYRH